MATTPEELVSYLSHQLVDAVSLVDGGVQIGTVTLTLEEAAQIESELLAGNVTVSDSGASYVVLPDSDPPIQFELAAESEDARA